MLWMWMGQAAFDTLSFWPRPLKQPDGLAKNALPKPLIELTTTILGTFYEWVNGLWRLLGLHALTLVHAVDWFATSFITKGNLRYLLGDSFPEDEINSIISEAASDSEEGISYTDFLSQWKDNKEAFLKLWEQNMVPGTVVHESKTADGNEKMDLVSEVSFDINYSSGDEGASNFREEKAVSMRKKKNLQGISTSLRE